MGVSITPHFCTAVPKPENMEGLNNAVPELRGVRNYCFTFNNPDGLLDFTLSPKVTFAVYQLEIGDEGTPHFQGYLELDSAVRMTTIKEWPLFPNHIHLEARRGTQAHAIRYCVKPDFWRGENIPDTTRVEGPWFYGEPKGQGQRNDILEVQRSIRAGASNKRVAEDHFPEWVRFNKSFKEYKRIITPKRNFKPTVILIVGPPGLGKSRFATALCEYLGSTYKVPDKHTGFWCDDYDNEDVFFMDEFDGDRMRPKAFNDLADRYECVIPSHGSAGHQLVSKYMVFCSNYMPKYWWKKRSETQLKQTTRRIDWTIKLIPSQPKPQICAYCELGLCAFHHP